MGDGGYARMTFSVPDGLRRSPFYDRLETAVRAISAAGPALMRLRGVATEGTDTGEQLKTAVDLAAEGWVTGYLEGRHPGDVLLCEERYERDPDAWRPADAFWTVDALDGTRSYVEGFDGFCVQVAYVSDGAPRLGAIMEPVADVCFAAIEGCGAHRLTIEGSSRLPLLDRPPESLRFVDSRPPRGLAGAVMQRLDARFVEHGGIGGKLCRIADGSADVLMKELAFKLWDVAPGDCILRELGGFVSGFDGAPLPYDGSTVRFERLLASRAVLRDPLIAAAAEVAA